MSKNVQWLFGLHLKAEKKEKVFLEERYFEKNTNNLSTIKNYSFDGFSICSQILSAFCTASDIPTELDPLTIISFFFIT